MNTPDLFDHPHPEVAEAHARMNYGRDWHFIDEAERAIRFLCRSMTEISSDEVWELLSIWKVAPPVEPRSIAVSFQRAKRAGLIEPSDRTKISVQKANHGRPVRKWIVK